MRRDVTNVNFELTSPLMGEVGRRGDRVRRQAVGVNAAPLTRRATRRARRPNL